jgi:putative hydrolase of the HAD superfamily
VTISIPGVVLFDYGEVISVSPTEADRAALLAIADVPAAPFWAAYDANRRELDGGTLPSGEYWRRIAAACGADWDAARIQALWNTDMRSWLTAEPGVVTLLDRLRAGGTRLALLSNAAEEYGGLLRFSPVGRWFERVFVSGELRMLKPDPEIFLHVASELGIPPAALVFVDNRADNVRGAESVGATGHLFTDADRLAGFLDALARDAKESS